MPRQLRKLIYSSEDWNLMQNALLTATKKLHRAYGHEDTDRLARRVMTLFDRGLRDVEVIASAAAYQEVLVARIAAVSGKHRG
ncbi:hypothetical protein FHS21_003684 [Phyllobacterium trifolii]|uniref:Uncharacterized protein n=1 Tax=Phyllobacterium trifolii TaxID=300193 RepID=A0A839U8X8_9HYPH|nr:hypothetical protein [Phyllobacterium trifolii]MBB3147268.1 hypothetical protein [Phyllobacterium trifolii]